MKNQNEQSAFSLIGKNLAEVGPGKSLMRDYEPPQTTKTGVETESGFMDASIFDPDNNNDKGVSIQEHGFASPNDPDGFEGNYGDGEWDQI